MAVFVKPQDNEKFLQSTHTRKATQKMAREKSRCDCVCGANALCVAPRTARLWSAVLVAFVVVANLGSAMR